MKKISIFFVILSAFVFSACFGTALAGNGISADGVAMRELNPPDGSIYFGGGAPSYSLTIQNPDSRAYDVSLSYTVTDQNGAVVLQPQTERFTVGEKQAMVKSFKVREISENGIYTVAAEIKGDFGTVTKTDKFSVAEKNSIPSDFMGVSTHFGKFHREQVEDSEDILKNGGFGWVRDEIYWEDVMTDSGCEVPEFAEEYVDVLTGSGTKILLTLGLTHPSYDGGAFPSSGEAVAAYAEYCGFLAEHFKGKIDTFEIYNEPDLYTKQDGSKVTGADYARLVKAAYSEIKKAQPNATVVVGALTEAIGSEPFLRDMLAVPGISVCIDALSFHPYANTGYYADENTYKPNRNILLNIKLVENALNDAGLGDVPIWITEYGTSSRNDASVGYTEAEQAINLVRASVLARTNTRVERTFIYNLKEKGTDDTAMEDNFGILEYTGMKAKPAFLALSYMNSMLGGAKFESFEAEPAIMSRDLSAAKFRDISSGADIFVLWGNKTAGLSSEVSIVYDKEENEQAELDGKTIRLSSAGMAEAYDLYGGRINITGGKLTVGEEPVYVVCTGNSMNTIKENNGRVSVSGLCANANESVTLVVTKENDVGKDVFYVDQTTANAGGEYLFEFDIDGGDIYKIYVYNGAVKTGNGFGNENYDFNIDYFVNGEELKDFSQIKTGDTVKMTVRAKDLNGLYENLTAFAVIYGNGGAMKSIDMAKPLWNDVGAVFTASVKIESAEDIRAVKFMLWNEDMQPEFNAAVSEKGED